MEAMTWNIVGFENTRAFTMGNEQSVDSLRLQQTRSLGNAKDSERTKLFHRDKALTSQRIRHYSVSPKSFPASNISQYKVSKNTTNFTQSIIDDENIDALSIYQQQIYCNNQLHLQLQKKRQQQQQKQNNTNDTQQKWGSYQGWMKPNIHPVQFVVLYDIYLYFFHSNITPIDNPSEIWNINELTEIRSFNCQHNIYPFGLRFIFQNNKIVRFAVEQESEHDIWKEKITAVMLKLNAEINVKKPVILEMTDIVSQGWIIEKCSSSNKHSSMLNRYWCVLNSIYLYCFRIRRQLKSQMLKRINITDYTSVSPVLTEKNQAKKSVMMYALRLTTFRGHSDLLLENPKNAIIFYFTSNNERYDWIAFLQYIIRFKKAPSNLMPMIALNDDQSSEINEEMKSNEELERAISMSILQDITNSKCIEFTAHLESVLSSNLNISQIRSLFFGSLKKNGVCNEGNICSCIQRLLFMDEMFLNWSKCYEQV